MKQYRRVSLCVLASMALVVVGCGDDDDDADTTAAPPASAAADTAAGESTAPAEAEPQTIEVQIDGRAADFASSVFAYMPASVTVHPGDTISYHSNFTGEPHSIAFGRDITELIELVQSQPPEVQSGEAPPPTDVGAQYNELSAKIPAMLPDGPGDAIQTSVNPCFVATGEIPSDPTAQCPVTTPEPFTGTETFYNSGFLEDGATFDMTLADDLAPGTYVGFCTLHFEQMISEVTVVPAEENVPTADEVAAAAAEELDALTAPLAPTVAAAEAGGEPGKVMAGVGDPEVPQTLAVVFAPSDAEVAAGDPITWTINGPHTVSFNPPESARTFLAKGPDGGFHAVEEALAPAGFTPPDAAPPEGDTPPPPTDMGTWDGTGFLSSGFLTEGDVVLTISTPGTYPYVCLIHPDMKGTVTVT